jgi:hypothetical protein
MKLKMPDIYMTDGDTTIIGKELQAVYKELLSSDVTCTMNGLYQAKCGHINNCSLCYLHGTNRGALNKKLLKDKYEIVKNS